MGIRATRAPDGGITLGAGIGSLVVLTLFVPYLSAAAIFWRQRLLLPGILLLSVMVPWLAVGPNQVGYSYLVRLWITFLAYAGALTGLAALLVASRMNRTLAGAMTVIVSLAWLSWPIWMVPLLQGDGRERTVAWLAAPHPIFTLNGALSDLFPTPWAQYRIAYELTNIGDDIPYQMPQSIWPCAALHLAIGVICSSAAFWIACRKSSPRRHGGTEVMRASE